MKNFTPNHGQNANVESGSIETLARQGTVALRATIRRVSFWAAILLPVVYLPLLSSGSGAETGSLVLGLLALNLIALFVGHNHH
ncbi:MAG: hypothetical protein R6V31_04295 [Halohasta sp.]